MDAGVKPERIQRAPPVSLRQQAHDHSEDDLFNLDFASRQVHTLTCDNCGLIHWFAKNIDRLRE